MDQSNFHNQTFNFSKQENIPIISKFNEAYKLWHSYSIHLSKTTRFTLGKKIDDFFTDCLEISLLASYRPKDKKVEIIENLNAKFETLKFFIKLLWEIKEIDTNKLTTLSGPLVEIGKMLGGWIKFFK